MATVEIDTELVSKLVADQFPQLATEPIRPVGTQGWDNATFRLGNTMMVRLPRFERWVGQVSREQTWLPRLAPHLPLAIPKPLAQGTPTADYPFPWSIFGWLPGERADQAELTDLRQAATDLANFLTALWAIDPADGPPPEWSNGYRGCDLADERDSPVVASRMAKKFAELEGKLDTTPIKKLWEEALATPVWHKPPAWVHGDPAPPNLLADNGRLTAVIDFGTTAVGDPAVDLIAAWTLLDPEARQVFRETANIDDNTWSRGRGWGLSALLPDPNNLTTDSVEALENLLRDH